MTEYHKIVTVWERDPETKFRTLIEGKWATPEFEYLCLRPWTWTEKVDGTNVRVMWDGLTVTYGGKTDRAQLPPRLLQKLQARFTAARMAEVFGTDGDVCLYGEGYGAKIQKGGGNYIADGVDFVLFDVLVNGIWLERHNVDDIGRKLIADAPGDRSSVPIVGVGSLMEAVEHVRTGAFDRSVWGDFPPEGLVMRPTVELLDRRGNRVIAKVKRKDFPA